MRLATLLLEVKLKLTRLTLLLEDDVIECLERERHRHLRSDIARLETCVERQELRAAIDRCRETEADELREMLDAEFMQPDFERRFGHSHLRNS